MTEPGQVDAAFTSVYKDEGDEWRWRARDSNGAVIATSGEGYKRRKWAANAAKTLFPKAMHRDYDDARDEG